VTLSEVPERNKIYTSEVNNPYYFPLEGINTVGVGEIKGIASVTKALSQGQFGQFPLYVFSTDGIWAMEVGSNGLYTSVKPVSRDVCINGNSITQTDNSVLFVSDRGVMSIDGSEVSCISDMMNGPSFDTASVCYLDNVISKETGSSDLDNQGDFMDYAKDASMAYDYPNGRILLFKNGSDICYVYSMVSGTWATAGIKIENSVSDYPDAYIQNGRSIIKLSQRIDYDNERDISTLVVTRPVKFGSDEFKTVYEMVVRGSMKKEKCAVILWGSINGERYVLIADALKNRIYRTGGRGYRYFRIGIIGNMKVGETLSMISVGFKRKYQNKLR
jgi:hypothetical protein